MTAGVDSDLAPGAQRLHAAAPAKINFGLRLVGRRADGYHEIESIFLPLDLADDLRLNLRRDTEPRVTLAVEQAAGTPEAAVPTDDRNLAARAARAFLESARLAAAVDIRLAKRIPAAAGLGGGSSDAGAVLRTLAAAFPDALSPDAVARLGLRLGADVPFFLDPRPALVTGVGERRGAPRALACAGSLARQSGGSAADGRGLSGGGRPPARIDAAGRSFYAAGASGKRRQFRFGSARLPRPTAGERSRARGRAAVSAGGAAAGAAPESGCVGGRHVWKRPDGVRGVPGCSGGSNRLGTSGIRGAAVGQGRAGGGSQIVC